MNKIFINMLFFLTFKSLFCTTDLENLKQNQLDVINIIKQAVVANGTNVPGTCGITIFMPLFPGKFCCKPEYSQTLFCQTFPNWLNFLQTFIASNT